MNILFDFLHPVDINFFKYSINILKKDGHEIFLIYRDRGPIEKILNKEFSLFNIKKIGTHKQNFLVKIFGEFNRSIELIKYFNDNKIDIGLSFGPSIGLACKMRRIPFLSFADDPEYKLTLYYALAFASKLIMPKVENLPSKVFIYNGYKELAYLHPDYYTPINDDLELYGLKANEYVFIREVSKVSLNYKNKKNLSDEIIYKLKKKGLKIVMSLEDKSQTSRYSNDCIILKEPLNDIHSVIKNALFSISSGDTIARESVLLGTPCIYIGGRTMQINNEFINMGLMQKIEDINKIKDTIDYLAEKSTKDNMVNKVNYKINNFWDSPTDIILNHISNYLT